MAEEPKEEYTSKAQIYRVEDCKEDMLYDLEHGKEKGSTTYIPELDNCWKWRKGEFNIWTGYMNEGKSLFIRYLCTIKALKENWKFIFCAPEDYPPKEFFDDIIHTVAGITTDNTNPHYISKDLYLKCVELIKDNFIFVYVKPPHNTIKGVLSEFETLIKEQQIDACIIDPIVKFSRPKASNLERDDIYAAYVCSICTDFSREHNLSLHLVMHQLTPRVTEEGFYPKPSPYQIKGGGSWTDSVDNVLSVWRPVYAKDKLDDQVIFSSQKIKKQKLVGIPQDFKMRFNRRTNRYIDYDRGTDLFPFSDYIIRENKPYFLK